MKPPGTARSPEELDTLLEDAFVLRDRQALTQLFRADAVIGSTVRPHLAAGRSEIASAISAIWEEGGTYVARPPRVLQTRHTALVIAGQTVHVVRRDGEGWRYLISEFDT